MNAASRLETRSLEVRHGTQQVLQGLDLAFPNGGFTVIVGPNGCGKSTLLRTLARLHEPSAGAILLDGRAIASYGHRERAQCLSVLPQGSVAPEGVTVADLVARGRHPHQHLFRRWSAADTAAVTDAMAAAGVSGFAARRVEELSGGERQKVWIAMALAQETDILLLDEPTTFLDLAHQIEVLELCRSLNDAGKTIIAVLHDLNQACRYATHLVAMKKGVIQAQGRPDEIVTEEMAEAVFGIACTIIADPVTNSRMVVPGRRPPPV